MGAPARFGFIPLRSPLMNDPAFEGILREYAPALEACGGERWTADRVFRPEPLSFFVASGGTEGLVLELFKRREDHDPGEPALLIAHPGDNSLPAALEALARLQQDGIRGRIIYLNNPDDARGLEILNDVIADLTAYAAMRRARIGLIGPSSDWLVASMPSHVVVRERWGPTVASIPLGEVVQAMQDVPSAQIAPLARSLVEGSNEVREPSPQALEDAARVYLALRRVIEHHHLSALTVRCFDLVLGLKTTGCFALAQLNDEGVIAGCEGDLMSAIGMLWAQSALEETPWMANPARLDDKQNRLWLAHCTVPRSMVREYRLRSHFESGLGVGIQGFFETGPVTLLRVGGRNMDKLWMAEGQILRAGDEANLCRTQVEVQLERGGEVADLLRHPLGNHIVLVRGQHLDRLLRYRASIWDETLEHVG